MGEWISDTVINLQSRGLLRVEDGNHGESRPRPHEFVDEGTAFIRAADMSDGKILFGSASKINPIARERITKGIGRSGDVLISHKGTVGKIARAPSHAPDFVCSPQTTFWRSTNEKILSQDFLYVYMRSPSFMQQFLVRSGETDMAGYVSLTSQRCLTLTIPPIKLQNLISSVISALDDKIEMNRQTNQTLEAMAQAIFKDWFVDFGPTRAKMEGREAYLASELWELFSDRFDEHTGLPDAWKEQPLDEIADFLNGLALQKFPATEGEPSIPVIKIAELRGGITPKSNRASRKLPEKYVVKDGDFLFSWSGSLLAKFWTEGEGALNQHLFKVSSDRYPAWFFSRWVYHHLEEFQRIAASKATTMGHIQREHLTAAKTNCPPDDVLTKLGEISAPLLEAAIKNDLESRALAHTRDILLPKLMSGEIRLRDAEKTAGEAL
jgi:type I restriction enzyme, S subunit